MPSNKTEVIRAIFFARWNARTKKLSKAIVTLNEVSDAIAQFNQGRAENERLSTRNPANFFKDFIRIYRSANANWPSDVFQQGYTGRQMTGGNNCFEFVLIATGQTEPFPVDLIPEPADDAPRHRIESASMPLASRRLGRTDESWLLQVVVRLRIIETHLSLFSGRQFVQIDLLQMGIKQAGSEIDALFLAIEPAEENQFTEMLVTLEAKGRRDDILLEQIIAQVKAVFRMSGVTQDAVIPTAAKNLGGSQIHVLQFAPVLRADAASLQELTMESEAVYELVPPVPGIE